MSPKAFVMSLVSLSLIPLLALPVLAQDATPEATEPALPANAIVGGLNSPNGIAYDANGNLYVSIGGAAGDKLVSHSEQEGDTYAGLTGQIIEIAPDGTQTVVVDNLLSGGTPGNASSAERIAVNGDSLWYVVGGGVNSIIYSDAVIEVDKATLRVKNYIDLYTIEATQNPDGNEINSNPFNLAWGPDGTLYIVDAGANTIYTWTQAAGLKVFHTWPDDPVPTSIRFASSGDIYVSFLGTGIAPGAGHIEHWSADGKTLIETFANLTAVMDILVDKKGDLYAVQLAAFGDQGPMPNSGSVIKVTKEGTTPVAEGLNAPFSIAQAPDGTVAVSINSVFSPPASGAVIKLDI